jgi:hypothetical protein
MRALPGGSLQTFQKFHLFQPLIAGNGPAQAGLCLASEARLPYREQAIATRAGGLTFLSVSARSIVGTSNPKPRWNLK